MTILQPGRVNGRQLHEYLLIGLIPDKPSHVCTSKQHKLEKVMTQKNTKISLKHDKHVEKLENMKLIKLSKFTLRI